VSSRALPAQQQGPAIHAEGPSPLESMNDPLGVQACAEAACLRHRPYPREAGALGYYTSASFRRIMQAGETSATDLRVTVLYGKRTPWLTRQC
jgi:hypothetical protein